MGASEARFAHDPFYASGFEFVLAAAAEALDNISLALTHAFHVNGDCWCAADCSTIDVHTIIRTTASEVGDTPTCDHSFSRCAAFINACPADVLTFDES